MATSTERFGFTKPAGSDPASVVPLNSNIDLIELYLGRTQDSIAPLYDDTETYSVGDLRTYESRLYKCNTDISTPETFDPEKWDLTTAVQEGGGGGSGASAIEKTQAEYDALTPAQKTNGAIYMVQSEIGEEKDLTERMSGYTSSSGTVSAYNSKNANFLAWHALASEDSFDASVNGEYWAGNGDGAYLQFDFTNPVMILKIGFASYLASNFKIMYSTDGNEYIYAQNVTREAQSGYICTKTDTTLDSPIRDCVSIRLVCDGAEYNVGALHFYGYDSVESVNKIYYMGTEYANTNGGSGGGGSISGEGVEIYSEDEYIVGKWIDGKKLYQRTYHFSTPITIPSSGWFTTNISNSDKDTYVEVIGVSPSKAVWNFLGATGDTGDYINILNVRDTAVECESLTLRYTKIVETPAPAWGGSVTNNYANFIDTSNVIDSGSYQGSFTYTATEDCFINIAVVMSANDSATITIDGAVVTSGWCASLNTINPTLPLKKGQTLVATSSASNTSEYTVYGITYASGGSSSGSSVEYSTEEKEVGTWIDGSKLYEKTIYCASKQGRGSVVIANYPTSNDIDYFSLQNISYVVNNTYYEGLSIAMEVACGSSGVALDNNNAPSGFPTNFTDIYTTIRYVKKAVS